MKLNVGILVADTLPTAYKNWAETWLPTIVDEVNVEFINARSEIVREDINFLIIIGGADVYPARYGAKPSVYTGKPNMDLEWWDTEMLPQYVERCATGQLAILGICRGMQTLNVHFGGKLSQHIAQEYSDPRGKLVDKLEILSAFLPSWKKFKETSRDKSHIIEVNSLHHQGMYTYQCAKPLTVVAVNTKFSNNVEVCRHKELNIWGTQFHPEELMMPDICRWILTNLINGIKK